MEIKDPETTNLRLLHRLERVARRVDEPARGVRRRQEKTPELCRTQERREKGRREPGDR